MPPTLRKRKQSLPQSSNEFIDPSAPRLYGNDDSSETESQPSKRSYGQGDSLDKSQQSNPAVPKSSSQHSYVIRSSTPKKPDDIIEDIDAVNVDVVNNDDTDLDEEAFQDPVYPILNEDDNDDINSQCQALGSNRVRTQSENSQCDAPEQDSSSRYKNRPAYQAYPILCDYFHPIMVNNKKSGSKCKSCSKLFITHANGRLFEHLIYKCKNVSAEEKNDLEQVWKVESEPQVAIEYRFSHLLTRVILKNNLPIRLAECELFRKLCKMHPPVQFPSRHKLSRFYIPRISRLIEDKFFKDVKNGPNYSLSIEFDHWTDSTHRSLLAILATKGDGSRHLIDIEDVSLVGHSSESIVSTLNRTLAQIEPLKINSIVSDAAASCAKARFDFVGQQSYKHVIHQRCIAHLLNLIGKDISDHSDVEEIMRQATKLVSILSSDTKIVAEFTKAGQRRCTRYVKTRWYSTVTMLESLVNCQDLAIKAIREAIRTTRGAPHPDRLACLEALQSDMFGPDLFLLLSIFRPLANCIVIAESSHSHLGETMAAMLQFARSLFESDWEVNFVIPTIEAFLTHFNAAKLTEDGLGIMVTAYFLDKRNKMNYITKQGGVIVLQTLFNLARGMGYSCEQISQTLGAELHSYWSQEGSYRRNADRGESAENWWRNQPDIGILKALALRIVSLRSSSANIERVFSATKSIQSPNRHRFSLATLTSIARARVTNRWIEYGDGEEYDDNESLDSTGEASTSSLSRSTPSCAVDLESGQQAFRRNLYSSRLGALDSDDGSITSSISDSSNDIDPPVKISSVRKASHHIPKRLSTREVKKSYKRFFKIFDFEIINGDTQECEESRVEDSPQSWKVTLAKFKSAMKNRKGR